MDWRLLVEGCIANIGIPPHNCSYSSFVVLFNLCVIDFLGYLCFANQPTVLGGVSRGRVVAVVVCTSDMLQVTGDMRYVRHNKRYLPC